MCGSMADIQSAAAEIRRGKKKKKEERNYRMKILWSALLHRAAITTVEHSSDWVQQKKKHVMSEMLFRANHFAWH